MPFFKSNYLMRRELRNIQKKLTWYHKLLLLFFIPLITFALWNNYHNRKLWNTSPQTLVEWKLSSITNETAHDCTITYGDNAVEVKAYSTVDTNLTLVWNKIGEENWWHWYATYDTCLQIKNNSNETIKEVIINAKIRTYPRRKRIQLSSLFLSQSSSHVFFTRDYFYGKPKIRKLHMLLSGNNLENSKIIFN